MADPTPQTTAMLDESQFSERFVREMLRVAGPLLPEGESVESYGRDVAQSYWEEQYPDMSPEECARTDISYWEE